MTQGRAHLYAVAIDASDIDFMGHVNNASYLKWVQAAVMSHWQGIAPAEAIARHLWVALKHEITYRKPAFLEDDVMATVLVEKVQGARAFYRTIIRRGEDVLAEVRSSWCCLDADTRRPARIAANIVERFLPPDAPLVVAPATPRRTWRAFRALGSAVACTRAALAARFTAVRSDVSSTERAISDVSAQRAWSARRLGRSVLAAAARCAAAFAR